MIPASGKILTETAGADYQGVKDQASPALLLYGLRYLADTDRRTQIGEIDPGGQRIRRERIIAVSFVYLVVIGQFFTGPREIRARRRGVIRQLHVKLLIERMARLNRQAAQRRRASHSTTPRRGPPAKRG